MWRMNPACAYRLTASYDKPSDAGVGHAPQRTTAASAFYVIVWRAAVQMICRFSSPSAALNDWPLQLVQRTEQLALRLWYVFVYR